MHFYALFRETCHSIAWWAIIFMHVSCLMTMCQTCSLKVRVLGHYLGLPESGTRQRGSWMFGGGRFMPSFGKCQNENNFSSPRLTFSWRTKGVGVFSDCQVDSTVSEISVWVALSPPPTHPHLPLLPSQNPQGQGAWHLPWKLAPPLRIIIHQHGFYSLY